MGSEKHSLSYSLSEIHPASPSSFDKLYANYGKIY